ncbi:helix-turn-helix domain-containing protein [Nocardioides sp. P5_C9_2]
MPPSNGASPPVRVAVADDSELVVHGLRSMLAEHAADVVLVPLGARGAVEPSCDLTLYDPAYVLRRTVRVGTPSAPVTPGRSRMVAYSWDCSHAAVSTELARGAAGYLGKRVPAERLVRDLVRIGGGRVVVDVAGAESRPEDPATAAAWPLTPRETVVLSLISSGRSNHEIADETRLSINSIKSYIRATYAKIGVSSRSQAVLWGVQHGLLVRAVDDHGGADGPDQVAGPGVPPRSVSRTV